MKGERIAQLELILRSHPEGLRKSEIARKIGVHRSTIGRYIEELKQFNDIYEDNNMIKIIEKDSEEKLSLSVYESLALNMGAEFLLSNSEFKNPHLATGLRKIAMNMKSYAPKIAENIIQIADDVEKASKSNQNENSKPILEALIDAWISGKIVRIKHFINNVEEETELAPYFIGFIDSETGRKPMTVTGRLRHTSDIVTIDILKIVDVFILDETYTIPENLKAFRKHETPDQVKNVIDTIPLQLLVREKSALNSFRTLSHGEMKIEKQKDGRYKCSFEAENSIELLLRIIQCLDSVEIIAPLKFKNRFVNSLEKILSIYK